MASWVRRLQRGDAISAGTTTNTWLNNNAGTILAGDLLVFAIASDTQVASVSDNQNGSYTQISSFINASLFVSVWMFKGSVAIALNTWTTTVTLAAVGNAAIFGFVFDGGDGSLNHSANTGSSVPGNNPNTIAANDTAGNLLFFASASNSTETAGTGDLATGTFNDRGGPGTLTLNTGYLLNEASTGNRGAGITLAANSDWSCCLAFFNLSAPASTIATQTRSIQKRRVKPIRPRSIALVAAAPVQPVPTLARAKQKRRVLPLRVGPFPRALVAPAPLPPLATRARTILKRILRPLLRSRSRVSPIPPAAPTEGCVTLSDGLVTRDFPYDGVVTKVTPGDSLVTTLDLLDELCR